MSCKKCRKFYFVLLVDKAFREGVHQRLARRESPDFSRALHDIFYYEPHLWSDARTEARDLSGRRGSKRDFDEAFAPTPTGKLALTDAGGPSQPIVPRPPGDGLTKAQRRNLRNRRTMRIHHAATTSPSHP